MLSDTKLGAFGRVIQLRFLGSQVFAIQTTIVEIMVHLSYDEVKLLIYGYIRHFFFHLLVIMADIKHLNLLQLEMSGLDDVFLGSYFFFFQTL